MQGAVTATRHKWTTRWGLLLVGIAPVAAQLFGSAFNIFYNIIHINHLLVADQPRLFTTAIVIYNAAVYPVAAVVWIRVLLGIRRPFCLALEDQPIEAEQLARAQRLLINLPWWGATIGSVAWLLCIPAFLVSLSFSATPIHPLVQIHLPISLVIAGMIGVTHAFFLIEVLSHRLLYPVLFKDTRPAEVRGAYPLSLRGRGIMWAIAAGVCPVVCLLLLVLAPHPPGWQSNVFAVAVAVTAIAFGLTTAWLLGRLIARPIHELREAAGEVARGNLNAHVGQRRADEFGPLIDEFNDMVAGLREKERLRETFGVHVGREAARHILQRDPGLGGVEQEVTIMFTDIRGFTARCSQSTAAEIVQVLNLFLTDMVDIVEEHCGGMVNKFLGDGFMAVFGAGDDRAHHAEQAVRAAIEMLSSMDQLNRRLNERGCQPLAIGVGIHTGPAVVGVVGSPQRQEFTVIGDTVNVASRVESLTKSVGQPILITEATRNALPTALPVQTCPPQQVKGKDQPLIVFAVDDPRADATHTVVEN